MSGGSQRSRNRVFRKWESVPKHARNTQNRPFPPRLCRGSGNKPSENRQSAGRPARPKSQQAARANASGASPLPAVVPKAFDSAPYSNLPKKADFRIRDRTPVHPGYRFRIQDTAASFFPPETATFDNAIVADGARNCNRKFRMETICRRYDTRQSRRPSGQNRARRPNAFDRRALYGDSGDYAPSVS